MEPYRRLSVVFGDAAFPGRATILFEADEAEDSGPAQSVTVEAGRRGTWVLTFRPGEDLPAGAQVAFRKVENEFRFDWRHQDYWPRAMGYVSVEDGQGEPLLFETETALKAAVPAIVTLPRAWRAGEALVVRIGDRRQGGVGVTTWPTSYERARMVVGVKLPEDAGFRQVPDATMSVRVVPRPPVKRYYLFAPSTAPVDGQFSAVALPVDINGNPLEGGEGVRIASSDPVKAEVSRGPHHTLHARLSVRERRVTRLELCDPDVGISARSNPIRVGGSDLNVYWGEFHSHGFDAHELNVLNDNTDPDKLFRYGRDATRLDFLAPGSHIFRQVPGAVTEWWELYRQAARRYNEDGRYVTFMGCEWRDREDTGGDRNLVWKYLDAPMPDPTWRIDEVYQRFPEQQAMVIPHVGGAIAFPCCHDGRVERLCEITSGHGNFEWFAQAYLQKGYRVGLIGGSDGHKGTPGHPRVVGTDGGRFFNLLRRRDAGWIGGPILAVYAPSLDREALWEAFRQRRTYATTGARALLGFRANGSWMGSEIESPGNVTLDVSVHGTAPVERVDLIRGPHRLARWEAGDESFRAELVDRPPTGDTYYYVRVEQEDGELLWSSPVWVSSTGGGSSDGLPAWNEPEDIDLATIPENEAGQYLPDLLEYLRREENLAAFEDITAVKVVHSSLGSYAVFFCHVRGKRIRIHWFYEFEIPRLRLEVGWVQYGREIIKGQPWTAPLVEMQDTMA